MSLLDFVRESNRIEGIHRKPYKAEVLAAEAFMKFDALTVGNVQTLVNVYQPGAKLRRHPGMNVRIRAYSPPRGGTHIEAALIDLLDRINAGDLAAYNAHLEYESLHPFTDGNGRSGRAIWLWQMLRGGSRDEDHALDFGFLHTFYYQTLDASSPRTR